MIVVSLLAMGIAACYAFLAANGTEYDRLNRIGIVTFIVSIVPCLGLLPPPLIFAMGLAATGWIGARLQLKPSQLRRAIAGSFVLSLLVCGLYGVQDVWEQNGFRESAFPVESLEDRLPVSPVRSEPRRSDLVDHTGDSLHSSFRSAAIEYLHRSTVQRFVRSPGFGVGRMNALVLTNPEPPEPLEDFPIPRRTQPHELSDSAHDVDDDEARDAIAAQLSEETPLRVRTSHSGNIDSFSRSDAWGYVTSERHAAGFEPHGMNEEPADLLSFPGENGDWRLVRLELVGLLRNSEPVVYESDNLPRMDELVTAPTRGLDGFEAVALEKLISGDDFVTRELPASLRTLGAIRAATQCVNCHGGQVGDLLGAFSYEWELVKSAEDSQMSGTER